MKERFYWIDIAKGIAMLLVILGHTATWEQSRPWINGINFFHVPIWIFLSALFINRSEPIVSFIRKRASRLLKPYYIYSFLTVLIHTFNTHDYINIFILCERKAGAIWFLPLLFSTSLIAYLILKLKIIYQTLACIFGLIISYLLTSNGIVLPFNIDIALYMLLFVVVANHYRLSILRCHYKFFPAFICLLLLSLSTFICKNNYPELMCNFFSSHLGILPITILLGFTGFYLIFYISQQIEKHHILYPLKQFLLFIGQNSIVFIIFHQKLCFNLLPLHRLSFLHPAYIDLIAFVIVISFCCIATLIVNKYFKSTIS